MRRTAVPELLPIEHSIAHTRLLTRDARAVAGAANWGGAMRAYFGDRVGARKVLSSLGKDYILPPFFTTTETASAVVDAKGGRTFGHYLTNCAHSRSRAPFRCPAPVWLCNMRR